MITLNQATGAMSTFVRVNYGGAINIAFSFQIRAKYSSGTGVIFVVIRFLQGT
jgi:hypothetical protein